MIGQRRPSPLTLGTIQLGAPYGLGKASEGLDEQTACSILDAAWTGGITCFDTARGYGEAEARIGRWRARHPSRNLFVASKFPALSDDDPQRQIRRSIDRSLNEMGLEHIDLYFAHHAGDLLRPGVVTALMDLVAEGTIRAFGASVYSVEDATALLRIKGLAALQIPLSLVNLSAADSGLLEMAAAGGISVFARSVFLQGLLLTEPSKLVGKFAAAGSALGRLEQLAREAGTTRAALALGAIRSLPGLSSIVVGVDSVTQLVDNLAEHSVQIDPSVIVAAVAIGRSFPRELVDPRSWQR